MRKLSFLIFLSIFFITSCDRDKPDMPFEFVGIEGTTITGNTIQHPTGNIKFNVELPKKESVGWELKYQPVLTKNGDAIRLRMDFGAMNKQNATQSLVFQDSVITAQGKVLLSLQSIGFPLSKVNGLSKIRVHYFTEFGAKTTRIIPVNSNYTIIDSYQIGTNKRLAKEQNDSRGTYCYRSSISNRWICTVRWDANKAVNMEAGSAQTVMMTLDLLDVNDNVLDFAQNPSLLNISTSNISTLQTLASPILSLGNLNGAVNTPVLVPINIANATFGAMSLSIAYNPQMLTFTGLAGAPQGMVANAQNGVLKIGWSTLNGRTWLNEKLVDLKFTYKEGTTDLQFLPNTEALKPDGRIVTDLNLRNGSVE